jgi:hypothetical protein
MGGAHGGHVSVWQPCGWVWGAGRGKSRLLADDACARACVHGAKRAAAVRVSARGCTNPEFFVQR